MKLLKEIGGRIAAAWALITFAVTFLIFFIPTIPAFFISDPKGINYLLKVARVWIRTWLFLIACPLEVKGTENFQEGETYVVACNHNSFLDPPLSSPFIPGPNKTIAKDSFTKVPIFGWYYTRGAVLVNRKNEDSRKKSFSEMKEVLNNGMHMCIYPEGTRNRTDQPLKKFYNGAFTLAVDTGKAVIPSVILNTKKALPFNKPFYFIPKKLEIHFLEPIPVENMTADELKDKVFSIMEAYILKHY